MGSYEDKYIQWTTLRQQRDQDVHELTNLFHTLRTKLGIKDSEKHLVLKYRSCLHRYIQEEMEFLDISSLGAAYRYAAKIEQKFKQKKRDFGSANQKQGKGTPKPSNKGPSQGGAAQDNPPKPQAKNNITKPKKDTGKWCEFHKSSTHNTSECRAKQSLVAELKASESDAGSDSESEPDKGNDRGKQIIDAEPNATVATTKIQKKEPEDPEEAGAPLPFPDVGKGFPVAVHCRQREPEEPHLSRGHETVGLADHNTPTTIHHRVAAPRTGPPRKPTMSPSLQHQALHG
jgi:hypothetical protein